MDKIKLTLKEGKEEKEKERLTLLGLTWVSADWVGYTLGGEFESWPCSSLVLL